jgi:hypothetical protein
MNYPSPNGKLKDFGYLDLFVRVSDDDELWAADTEHPNMMNYPLLLC